MMTTMTMNGDYHKEYDGVVVGGGTAKKPVFYLFTFIFIFFLLSSDYFY